MPDFSLIAFLIRRGALFLSPICLLFPRLASIGSEGPCYAFIAVSGTDYRYGHPGPVKFMRGAEKLAAIGFPVIRLKEFLDYDFSVFTGAVSMSQREVIDMGIIQGIISDGVMEMAGDIRVRLIIPVSGVDTGVHISRNC